MYLAFGMTATPFSFFNFQIFLLWLLPHAKHYCETSYVLSRDCCVAFFLSPHSYNNLVRNDSALPCTFEMPGIVWSRVLLMAVFVKMLLRGTLQIIFVIPSGLMSDYRACNYTWLLQRFHPKSPLCSASGAQWDVIFANGIRAMGMKIMIGRGGKMCIYTNHQLRYVKFLCL